VRSSLREFLTVRRAPALVAALIVLSACGDDCATPCQKGITFYVSELAGSLGAGSSEQVTLCLDADCKDVTVSRSNVGGSLFVPFDGVDGNAAHTVTLTGPGSLTGSYQGTLPVFDQSVGGGCASCAMAAVKIAADGTLTPGQAATNSTPTAGSTSTSGG
jgi:hypothetical protein